MAARGKFSLKPGKIIHHREQGRKWWIFIFIFILLHFLSKRTHLELFNGFFMLFLTEKLM